MDNPITESLNTSLPKFLLMAVTDGASVTETPRLKRGSMWYASAPFNSPILGHSTLTPVLGVGATLSACGASPSTRSQELRARWGHEAGSSALQGGVAHIEDITQIPLGTLEYYEGESLKWNIDTSEIVDLSPLNGVCTIAQRKLMKEHYILSKMGSFVVSLKTSTVGGFRNEKFIEYTKVSLQSNFSTVLQNILNTFTKIGR